MTYKIAFTSLFVLLLGTSFAQLNAVPEKSEAEKTKIKLEDKKNVLSDKTVGSMERVKIWTVGEEKPLTGFVTAKNDSILLIGETEVAINKIEKMRVTNPGAIVLGTVLTGGGAALTTGGVIMIDQGFASNMIGGGGLLQVIAGFFAAGVGTLSTATGVVILSLGSKKVDTERWNIKVVDKKKD